MKKITVLIADDHMIVRQGLKLLLETGGDIEIVGEAQNGEAAVQQARALRPNVVLVDIAMPLLNGIEAARQIHQRLPSTRILVLSTYHQDQEVREALAAGAHGYIMKESAGAELLNAVREVSKGRSFFSPAISQRISQESRGAHLRKGDDTLPTQHLTRRELEVLILIADGSANKQTALNLGISIKTVEKHRQSLMNKLHIHDAAGLTRYAIAKGVISCSRPSLVPANFPTHGLDIAAT